MSTLNLKSVACGFGALVMTITILLSWNFVSSTSIAHAKRDAGVSVVAAASVLVR